MDKLHSEYNMVKQGGNTLGYKHTEESIEKMRSFILSEETLNRKRQSTANASASNRVGIVIEDVEKKDKWEYNSLTEAGRELGVYKAAVSKALLNNTLIKTSSLKNKKIESCYSLNG